MSLGWTKTQRHRKMKMKSKGKGTKRVRVNKGTTARVPLEGPMPSLRFGQVVAADSIVVDVATK